MCGSPPALRSPIIIGKTIGIKRFPISSGVVFPDPEAVSVKERMRNGVAGRIPQISTPQSWPGSCLLLMAYDRRAKKNFASSQ